MTDGAAQDATLKRCFGEDTKVADCDWSYLSTLRTTREPRQPMPRLVDLLEYMAQPEVEHIWVLLDIKVGLGPSSRVAMPSGHGLPSTDSEALAHVLTFSP